MPWLKHGSGNEQEHESRGPGYNLGAVATWVESRRPLKLPNYSSRIMPAQAGGVSAGI